jgi:subtilase family serine protease
MNNGMSATNSVFYADLYLDGTKIQSWSADPPLDPNYYSYVNDYSIGPLSAGTHTLRIVIDATNAINESNENDNEFTKTINVINAAIPNLTPYQPSGWSDKIVVSNVGGTHNDSSPLYTTDTLYVDWAVMNNGTSATSGMFSTDLYLDGTKIHSWSANPLDPSYYSYVDDYSIGPLSAGNHTLRIATDTTNAINESNESDNEFTKTINVINAAPLQGWTLTVVNNYSLPLAVLYISPSSAPTWGSNWLSSPMPTGSSRTISNIAPGTYDLRVEASNGAFAEQRGITKAAGATFIWTLN